MENNVSASRQARRFLEDRVRTDWDYPPAPPAWSASDEEVRNVQHFRARYYADSESTDSAAEQDGASPYKFDSPDSIGRAVADIREARKRRRAERLAREMGENEGLRIWTERRNVWTGAASTTKYRRQQALTMVVAAAAAVEADGKSSVSLSSSSPPPPPPIIPPSPLQESCCDLIPVAPRLLATNTIRASITPHAYPDLFQKIVISSRTPSVPINLTDMTRALVQGWKDTGEWPSKAGALDPLAEKRRSLARSVAKGGGGGSFMGRHPHVEKSVDSVKKMLHWNNDHHHHHHHRGAEQHDGNNG